MSLATCLLDLSWVGFGQRHSNVFVGFPFSDSMVFCKTCQSDFSYPTLLGLLSFIVQIGRFVVLTGPAGDEILEPGKKSFGTAFCEAHGFCWACL